MAAAGLKVVAVDAPKGSVVAALDVEGREVRRLILGVDPGAKGAIAGVDWSSGDAVFAIDLPMIHDGKLAWVDGGALQSILLEHCGGRNASALVERVGAMPGQGVVSCFTFGAGLGSVLAILQARGIPIDFVTPGKWKREMGLSSDKRASLDKARLKFPSMELHLAKHEGRAEALLIAYYGRMLSERSA